MSSGDNNTPKSQWFDNIKSAATVLEKSQDPSENALSTYHIDSSSVLWSVTIELVMFDKLLSFFSSYSSFTFIQAQLVEGKVFVYLFVCF